MESFLLMVLIPFLRGEGEVAAASGFTVTSSKATERSQQMEDYLAGLHITTAEEAQEEELPFTSIRMILSHTSGNKHCTV